MKRLPALAAAAALMITLSACAPLDWALEWWRGRSHTPAASSASSEAPEADPNFPVTINDVTIRQQPERVVALNPSIAEILYDMGLESVLVGGSSFSSYPDAARELTQCGSETIPDTGSIIGRRAELVLTLNALPTAAEKALKEEKITVLTLKKPDSLEKLPEYYEAIACALLGSQAGKEAAAKFTAPLRAAREAIAKAAASAQDKPLGVFMALPPLTLATGDTLQGALLEECGLENAAKNSAHWQYPQDLLIKLDPDVLIADTRTVSLEEIKTHPNYKTTPCVKNDKLLGLDGSAIENCGVRLYQTMLDIARLAHPEWELPQSVSAFAKSEPSSSSEPASQGAQSSSQNGSSDTESSRDPSYWDD